MTESRNSDQPPHTTRGNFLAPAYLWVAGLQGRRALAFCAALGAVANLAFLARLRDCALRPCLVAGCGAADAEAEMGRVLACVRFRLHLLSGRHALDRMGVSR